MTGPVRQALVGAGANLGDRFGTLVAARERLGATDGVTRLAASALYRTKPVGVLDQPEFLNAVLGIETTLSPEDLLQVLLGIEQEFGRERHVRWGPRTLDLDLLAYEGVVRSTPALTLPHPRLWERNFVLVPLRELLKLPPFNDGRWDDLRAKIGPGGDTPDVQPWQPEAGDAPGVAWR